MSSAPCLRLPLIELHGCVRANSKARRRARYGRLELRLLARLYFLPLSTSIFFPHGTFPRLFRRWRTQTVELCAAPRQQPALEPGLEQFDLTVANGCEFAAVALRYDAMIRPISRGDSAPINLIAHAEALRCYDCECPARGPDSSNRGRASASVLHRGNNRFVFTDDYLRKRFARVKRLHCFH